MDRTEIDEAIETFEKRARTKIDQAKAEAEKRTQGLKEKSEDKRKELENVFKEYDEEFQRELDSLESEGKRLVEKSKAKAGGLEGKIESQIEDSKLRLKTEYRKLREDLLNK